MLPRKQISEDNARARLEELCARAEHCRFELAEKLRKWGVHPDVAGKILDGLHRARFFDDSRFASVFARDKALFSHWGKRKIALALTAKRIDRDSIDEALDALDPEEYKQAAVTYLRSRARQVKEGFTYEGRTKLFRNGIARGYETQLVSSIVKDPTTWGIADEDD